MQSYNNNKNGRYIAVVCFFTAIFLFFAGVLAKTQLSKKTDYDSSSLSVTTSEIKAVRGQILDRNGKVLVGNREGYDLIFDAEKFPSKKEQSERNKIIHSLIELFEERGLEWENDFPISYDGKNGYAFKEDMKSEKEKLLGREMLHLNKYATAADCMNEAVEMFGLNSFSPDERLKIAAVCCALKLNDFSVSYPYTFAKDVDNDTVSVIKENSAFYKGVDVKVVTYREYTDGEIAPHILGVTGTISKEEYDELKDRGYAMDDVVGKSGIEKLYEEELRGKNGTKTVTTYPDGTQKTEISGLENGKNIQLTIDFDLQKTAQDSLGVKCRSLGTKNSGGGAVVAMDCQTGEVLAMASYPTYNLTTYYDDYNELIKNVESPLYNRATLSTYAPGSTAKVSTAIACLEEGIIDEYSVKYCGYYYPFLDHTFVCQISHENKNITVKTALQDSCNSFFYYYGGEKLGQERMNVYRQMLGLGEKTGIEIPENTGVLDSPTYRASLGQPWMPGFSLQSAIGQAGNLFTPLQLANYVATVANGGTRYEVHLIKNIISADGTSIVSEKKPNALVETGIKQKNLDIVKAGMRLVVTNGSCLSTFGQLDYAVACKTGTSTVDKTYNGEKRTYTNGFNISFAPYESPEVAISVAIEGATSGGSCAPVACDIYDTYFEKKAETGSEDDDLPVVSDDPLLR